MKRQSGEGGGGAFKSEEGVIIDKMKYELKKYEKLYRVVVKSLEQYLTLLKNAEFQELSDTLTQPIIHTLAMTITGNQYTQPKLSINNFSITKTFDKYKQTFFIILDGIQQAQNLKTNNNQQAATILTLQEQANILTDINKLQEYVKEHYTGSNAVMFNINTNMRVAPVIYPQYLEYIRRHGLPENSVWESEKMSIIIIELLANGTITQGDIFI
jgi:hypothetical protein